MVTVAILGLKPHNRREVEILVGRLYRKGTDPEEYANFQERSQAHLAVLNLNGIPGIRARVMDE